MNGFTFHISLFVISLLFLQLVQFMMQLHLLHESIAIKKYKSSLVIPSGKLKVHQGFFYACKRSFTSGKTFYVIACI